MNQARKSAVEKIPSDGVEFALVQSLCTQNPDENITNTKSGKWIEFKNVLMKVIELIETIYWTAIETHSFRRFHNHVKICWLHVASADSTMHA